MTAELRRDLGGVGRHATVPLPAQRAPHDSRLAADPRTAALAGPLHGRSGRRRPRRRCPSAALYRAVGPRHAASPFSSPAPSSWRVTVAALRVARAWEPRCSARARWSSPACCAGSSGAAVVVALVGLGAAAVPGPALGVRACCPFAGALAVLGRMLLRKRLHRLRAEGRAMARVLAVGTEDSVAALVERTRRAPHHGWQVAGVCTPTGAGPAAARRSTASRWSATSTPSPRSPWHGGYDAVSVGQAPGWTPRRLQQLAWDLEGSRTELVVDPGLMEIAGPRLHVANVDGLPLLRLTHPTFAGAPKLLKGVIDRHRRAAAPPGDLAGHARRSPSPCAATAAPRSSARPGSGWVAASSRCSSSGRWSSTPKPGSPSCARTTRAPVCCSR